MPRAMTETEFAAKKAEALLYLKLVGEMLVKTEAATLTIMPTPDARMTRDLFREIKQIHGRITYHTEETLYRSGD